MKLVTLSKYELVNFLGINELRKVKNPTAKKQKGFMLGMLIFLCICLAGYTAGQAVMLAVLGTAEYIPVLFFMVAFSMNLVVGIYRAKATIYRESDLDLVSAFPLSGTDIVASRVFRLYFDNLVVGMAVLVPAFLVYGIMTGGGALFFISIIPICIISPILPTAIASWIGIIFAAIISRNRHKVLTEVILALVIVIGTFAFSGVISAKTGLGTTSITASEKKEMDEQMKAEMAAAIADKMSGIEHTFPPVKLVSDVLQNVKFLGILIYALISVAVILPTVMVIGRNFFSISRKLFSTRDHKEYRMEELKKQSVMTALVKKEAARYFSSGIYVSNTIVNPVMALILAVALGFIDLNKIVASAGKLPVDINANNSIPFLLALLYCMMTISASSVSMEGKNWWIMRTLPISAKEILGAKLLFNMIFIAPFYIVSEIIMLFTVNAGFLERIWLILIPGLTIVFSILFGLFLNLKFPKFDWENEVEVVKQSAAVGLSLVGTLPVLIACMESMILTGTGLQLLNGGFSLALIILSLLLYGSILKTKLQRFE